MMTMSPITSTIASPAVCAVSVKSGMTAGQACDPGFTRSTPTKAQMGRLSSHISAGPMIASPPAIRASAQVWRDAPCHSSAMK